MALFPYCCGTAAKKTDPFIFLSASWSADYGDAEVGFKGETESFHEIVFRSTGCDLTPLLVYLTLFSSAFVPVGMYKNLE